MHSEKTCSRSHGGGDGAAIWGCDDDRRPGSLPEGDLAAENALVNLVINVYPILHHRHTRVRIVRLLERDARRRPRPLASTSDPNGVESSGVGRDLETNVRA
jgi:hypothetical protein